MEQEERALQEKELAVREEELHRLHNKDKERRGLLTLRTKQYFDAFKGLWHKLPNASVEVIGYFKHLEGLFETYEVPADITPKLFQVHLNQKAKSMIVRLTREQLSHYD